MHQCNHFICVCRFSFNRMCKMLCSIPTDRDIETNRPSNLSIWMESIQSIQLPWSILQAILILTTIRLVCPFVRPAKCTSWEVSVLRHQAPTLLLYAVQNGKEKNRKSIKTKQLKPIKCHRKWFDVSIVERGNKWGASKLQFHWLHRKICHVHVIWSYFFDLCNYFSV